MTMTILYNPSTPDLYPRSVYDFRQAFPGLAVADNPRDEDVAPYGWRVVAPTAPPPPGPDQQVVEAPQPVEINGQWQQAWQPVDVPPPEPSPDWIAFELALNKEPAIINLLNDLGRASQIGALSLGHALEEAEHGNIDRFLPVWRELIIASAPPPATLARFRELAAAHHLPADFQAAIAAAPAGPPVGP